MVDWLDLPGYKHYVAPDGDRPDLMVCYLDVAERDGAAVNGVALRVGADERRLAIASSYHRRVLAGFDLLRQRRRFEMLTEPPDVPVADLGGRPPHAGGRAAQRPLNRA
jgi:hypothetical protein